MHATTSTQKCTQKLPPESKFAFSPNGKMIAYFDGDRIALWAGSSEAEANKSLKIYSGEISGMTFNENGDILAIYGNRGIVLWDINSEKELGKPLPGPVIPGMGITISPDGKFFASFATDGIVLNNLEASTDILLETGDYSGQLTSNMSFYAHGTSLVAFGDDGTLITWDVGSGKPTILDDNNQPLKGKSISLSAFSPEGKYLAYETSGHLNIWDVENSRTFAAAGDFPDIENSIGAVTFSSDGTLMAYTDGPKIILWDIQNKEPAKDTFLTGTTTIRKLDLIMSGATPKYVLTVDETGTAQIWDWASRTKIGSPLSGKLQIEAFDVQNQVAYYIDSKGRLIRWQWGLDHAGWVDLLCPLVKRNFKKEEWDLYMLGREYPITEDLLTCPKYPRGE